MKEAKDGSKVSTAPYSVARLPCPRVRGVPKVGAVPALATGAALVVLGFLVAACAPSATVTSGEDVRRELNLPPYDGPKVPIAIGPCEDKTGGTRSLDIDTPDGQTRLRVGGEIGRGMSDMLVTALVNTDRFMVLEADEAVMEAMERERSVQGERTPQRAMRSAEIVITCAVTEFEPNAQGAGGGVGDLLGDLFAAVAGGAKKSTVALDFRLVDTDTRAILTAFSVQGEASDAALGGALASLFGPAVALGGFQNTPIEKAVRVALFEAVKEIATRGPEEYREYARTDAAGEGSPPQAGDHPGAEGSASTRDQGAPPGPSGAEEEAEIVYVSARALNLRTAPNTDSRVMRSLPRGTELTLLERADGWCRVETERGREGWVSERYVADKPR